MENSKHLILTASTFVETSLKATEEVVRFSNIVETVGHDTMIPSRSFTTQADWSEKCNVTWWFHLRLWWQIFKSVDNLLGGMMHWIWEAIPGELKDQVIWGMLVECCLNQQLLCISSSGLLTVVQICWWRRSFQRRQMECWDVFWEGGLVMVLFCHVGLADSGVIVDEDVSLVLGIGDCSAIMGLGFIGRVGIWCTV